jgi:5-methylcytosine-specific restriction endonuclease McrA
MNKWHIPNWLELEVRERDTHCVYCGIKFENGRNEIGFRKFKATWEHIINNENIITRDNIALCCAPCNSSKGTKNLSEWIKSNYCKKNGINNKSVAEIIKKALRNSI